MKKFLILFLCFLSISCLETKKNKIGMEIIEPEKNDFGNFESQEKWGEHLVTILDCNACHTPKKMTNQGPVNDESLRLSGHPAEMPRIEIDRK